MLFFFFFMMKRERSLYLEAKEGKKQTASPKYREAKKADTHLANLAPNTVGLKVG